MRLITTLLGLYLISWINFSPSFGIFQFQKDDFKVLPKDEVEPSNRAQNVYATVKTTTKKKTTIRKTTKKTTKPTTTKKKTTKPTTTTKRTTTTRKLTTLSTPEMAINSSCALYGLNCADCGLSDFTQNLKQIDLKIVGGQEATPYSLPSQILLIQSYYDTSMARTSVYACGGTLIKPDVVLTAAHCLNEEFSDGYGGSVSFKPNVYYPTYEYTFDVYAAVHDKSFLSSSWNPPSPGVRRQVKRIVKHESYNGNNYLNDIALLILDEDITLNSYVKVACLPPLASSYPPENTKVLASGWGTLTFQGSTPNKLQNVMLTNYNSSMCENVSPSATKNWNSQICAGEYTGGKDTCQGDSGGPLYYRETINGKERLVVAGITSYGDGCALAGRPGIYSRASYYVDWIQENI